MLIAFVSVAALLAGLAGAWSPCGFSMVDTVAAGGRRAAVAAGAVAFAAGAVGGAVVTFGGLALLGDALGLAGGVAAGVAVAALLVASLGDAAGRRLVPQVRRQVPESWRRILPVPLAAGLYGVLLGLGFTTFVLSFATYGLAAACLALGDPAVGLGAGLAFGAGRAIPVLVLAPLQERDAGIAAAAAMAERPGILRGLRGAAATALAAAALVLALDGAPAHAQASVYAAVGSDPSAVTGAIVYEDALGRGILDRAGKIDVLPGSDPAIGPGVIAWYEPGTIVLADPSTLEPSARIPAPGVDAIALSARFVAWRAAGPDGLDRLVALDRTVPGAPARELITATTASGALGAPALEDTRMVFHFNGRSSSRILEVDLTTDARRVLRTSVGALLLNPALSGGVLAHVRSGPTRQQLRIGPVDGLDRIVYSTTPTARRDAGVETGRHVHRAGYRNGRPPAAARPAPGVVRTLWTTTMTPANVYLTVLRSVRGGPPTAGILRVPRDAKRRR